MRDSEGQDLDLLNLQKGYANMVGRILQSIWDGAVSAGPSWHLPAQS